MSPETAALWMLPLHCLKWGGVICAAIALLLLADLIWAHWKTGREIDHDIEEGDL